MLKRGQVKCINEGKIQMEHVKKERHIMSDIQASDVKAWVEQIARAIRSVGNAESMTPGGGEYGGLEALGMALAGPGVGPHSSMAATISEGHEAMARELGRIAGALDSVAVQIGRVAGAIEHIADGERR